MKWIRATRCHIAIVLSSRYDWVYWHARPLWSQAINDFLLRQIR